MSQKVCYLDLETTGLNAWKNGIHQIAMIIEIDGEVKAEHDFRVRPFPNDIIEPDALKISKLTRAQIMDYPVPKAFLENEIIPVLGLYVDKFDKTDKFTLAGYNIVAFDIPFLRNWFRKCDDIYFGSWFNNQPVDAMQQVFWCKFMGAIMVLENYKLTTVCKEFGVELKDAHDGLADIRATRELIQELKDLDFS